MSLNNCSNRTLTPTETNRMLPTALKRTSTRTHLSNIRTVSKVKIKKHTQRLWISKRPYLSSAYLRLFLFKLSTPTEIDSLRLPSSRHSITTRDYVVCSVVSFPQTIAFYIVYIHGKWVYDTTTFMKLCHTRNKVIAKGYFEVIKLSLCLR